MAAISGATAVSGAPAAARRRPFLLDLFARLVGPAALTAAGMIGAGAVATRLLAGAWFGFDLLWVALFIVPMVVVTLDSASPSVKPEPRLSWNTHSVTSTPPVSSKFAPSSLKANVLAVTLAAETLKSNPAPSLWWKVESSTL